MEQIDLPERAKVAKHIVAYADALKASGLLSYRAIEKHAGVSYGVIARMKSGEGFNYDTAKKLLSLMRAMHPAMEPGVKGRAA